MRAWVNIFSEKLQLLAFCDGNVICLFVADDPGDAGRTFQL